PGMGAGEAEERRIGFPGSAVRLPRQGAVASGGRQQARPAFDAGVQGRAPQCHRGSEAGAVRPTRRGGRDRQTGATLNPVVLPELRFRHLWFGVGVVIALFTAVVCLMPGNNLPDLRGVSDKVEHFAAFGLLSFWFSSI